MKYKLIVDSCCDLPPEELKRLEAVKVPLYMLMGERCYVDDENLDVAAFVEDMTASKEPMHSGCPAPAEFAAHYTGEDPIFVVTLSSRLSGSYDCAVAAIELARDQGATADVYVFDSKSASGGETTVALLIEELAQSGCTKEALIETVEAHIKRQETLFILGDVTNLVKNGRMNKVTGTFVSALHIHPLLSSDGDGNIIMLDKARGMAATVKRLVEVIGERCPAVADKTLVIAHCLSPDMANYMRALIEERYAFKKIVLYAMGGISSMYAAKGGVLAAF
ncbi:MAG TPA: DegV family protein [Candidatus Acidoferrum sp.]|nr:DegV family protein [Candidatus Acidoferrum sp.]